MAALITVPDLAGVYSATSWNSLGLVMFFGFLWGIAGFLFGLGIDRLGLAIGYGIILGITGSLQLTVSTVVWAKYFGRRHLGSITGVASLVSIAGSALGPMPMGIARDAFGSYNLALTVAAALPLVLCIVVLFTRRPHRASHRG